MRFLPLFLCVILFSTCKGKSSGSDETSPEEVRTSAATAYFQESSVIDLEIWYQENAEPYVRETALSRDLWQILRGNLTAIFQYRSTPPTIQVPSDLAEMHKLATAKQASWTSQQILQIWAANQTAAAPEGTSRFFIYFLDGYFQDENGVNENVLGVQIGERPVIAIFKPVIAGSSQGGLIIPKYMEQSTLVHEMGHALGFVNHGVPMVGDYQDVAHGAHSQDQDCVMYWLNEGASDLRKFVQKLVTQENAVLWGENVLADAKAFSR